MLKYLFSCFLLLLIKVATADPGVGIVMDQNGNLFYTDLSQVWMIKPDGSKIVAVPNVHTHELYIDKEGKLYGEHLWYNGEKLNTWGYYYWCRQADGSITKIKDSTAGSPSWYSFTRDGDGNMYYVEKSTPSYFWKIDTAGKKTILGSRSLSGIGRLHLNNKGVLFFSNKDDLYSLAPGDSVKLYVEHVGEKELLDRAGSGDHIILSTWSDKDGNLYIATGGVIKQIDKKKVVTTIYKSTGTWKPSGGLIAPNGDFWVMEYNNKNEVRVNKISMADRKQIVNEHAFTVYIMPLLLIAVILLALYFLFRKKK